MQKGRYREMQKLILIINGDSNSQYQLNRFLEEGWTVKQMQTESNGDKIICFVLIEKA